MAKRDLRPARCMHIEATPSGQGPLVRAHLRRYHVARGSSSGGAGAQGRGPLESISPCYAVQSFHDCLLGESGDHVGQGQPLCKWVSSSALSRVSEPRPPKRPPTRRLLLPRTGLAHGAGLIRGAFDFASDFRFGQEIRCCESRRSPPRLRRSVLALQPSWSLPPSFHGPVPPPPSWSSPFPPSTAPCLPLPPGPCPSLLPLPRSSPSLRPSCSVSHPPSTALASRSPRSSCPVPYSPSSPPSACRLRAPVLVSWWAGEPKNKN